MSTNNPPEKEKGGRAGTEEPAIRHYCIDVNHYALP